ncbi:hypothetical protein [Bacillus altitudinis]|uniref:hypothetical protein n=1 Tax=Bacillus altitudinis TaxID=293387 RepID=UPI0011A48F69|nr:hypothetical protein [Bacillus altitudinis]
MDKNSIGEGVGGEYEDVYELVEERKAVRDVKAAEYDGILFGGGDGGMMVIFLMCFVVDVVWE